MSPYRTSSDPHDWTLPYDIYVPASKRGQVINKFSGLFRGKPQKPIQTGGIAT